MGFSKPGFLLYQTLPLHMNLGKSCPVGDKRDMGPLASLLLSLCSG